MNPPSALSARSCPHPVRLGSPTDVSTCPRTLFPLLRNKHVEFGVEEILAGSQVPSHRHAEQTELIFVHRGQAYVFMNGQQLMVLEEGESVHILAGVEHAIKNTSKTASLWITYTLMPPMAQSLGSKLLENDMKQK